MRFYPDLPARRTATILADLAVLAAVLVFAWLGLKVHDTVDSLSSLGEGVQQAGSGIQSGFQSAADAVGDTPVIGGDLSGALEDAGKGSGGSVAEAGRKGEEGVHDLATLLGVLTFAIPTGLVLYRALPPRIGQVRRMSAANRVLSGPQTEERRHLLAQRAAFSMPYGALLRYTRDPLGDLEAGRLDALVEAAFADAGLRPARA